MARFDAADAAALRTCGLQGPGRAAGLHSAGAVDLSKTEGIAQAVKALI